MEAIDEVYLLALIDVQVNMILKKCSQLSLSMYSLTNSATSDLLPLSKKKGESQKISRDSKAVAISLICVFFS